MSRDGTLPCHQHFLQNQNCLPDCVKLHWSQLNSNVFLGYRGPLITLDKLLKLPNIIISDYTLQVDESTLKRKGNIENLQKLFAIYKIQHKWKIRQVKRRFQIVMGELKALPNAVDYIQYRQDFIGKGKIAGS